MALEYIYDAIRATAGEDIGISATITDEYGDAIESGCGFRLHDKDGEVIYSADGDYLGSGLWTFKLPASETTGLKGRYTYSISQEDNTLCFQTPIYFK